MQNATLSKNNNQEGDSGLVTFSAGKNATR